MFNFRQEISTIQQELRLLNKNLAQAEPCTTTPPPTLSESSASSQPPPVPKNLRGNEYSLRQFQYNQQRLNYRKQLRKESLQRGRQQDDSGSGSTKHEEKITVLPGTDAIHSWLQENEYKKKWFRLDAYQKRTKLREFAAAFPEIANTWSVSVEELCLKKYNKTIQYNAEKCMIDAVLLP